MNVYQATKPMFARHETFHPRYSWFRKAFLFTEKDPKIFLRKDATVQIGVGKNMVRSIRFWGLAAKLIIEHKSSPNRRRNELATTDIGSAIFGKCGWDCYMEDVGTLWLLHWLLLSPICRLPVWWLAFNELGALEFSDQELIEEVTAHLEANSNWANPNTSSVRKDVTTLLRTYSSLDELKQAKIEDYLDCPFRELNLIRYSRQSKKFRFVQGIKPSLPSEILMYSVLDFIAHSNTGGNTIDINRLANEPGSPGRIYKLSESELVDSLVHQIEGTNLLQLHSTTGAIQFAWQDNPVDIANRVLNDYYTSHCQKTDIGIRT